MLDLHRHDVRTGVAVEKPVSESPSVRAAFTTMSNVAEMAKIYGGMPFMGALPDSPAERAGLRWGDIVLAVNVRFVRDGIEHEVELTW
jgi:S1-C subfamily serine protease